MADRARDVFVNCPFDPAFQPLFEGIVFAIMRSGFKARCALETSDASENGFAKIQSIVEECRYGIHNLSRTESDGVPPLPRFNMPLELGLFLGAKRYGDAAQKKKRALVLDVESYRYQRFISDLAGQDIQSHHGEPRHAVEVVTSWLREQSGSRTIPGGGQIADEYDTFRHDKYPEILQRRGLRHGEVNFLDFAGIVFEFLSA